MVAKGFKEQNKDNKWWPTCPPGDAAKVWYESMTKNNARIRKKK